MGIIWGWSIFQYVINTGVGIIGGEGGEKTKKLTLIFLLPIIILVIGGKRSVIFA